MNLRCPLCGAAMFYIEEEDRLVFFEVTGDHAIEKIRPEGAAPAVDGETVIHCTACAWFGCITELVSRP